MSQAQTQTQQLSPLLESTGTWNRHSWRVTVWPHPEIPERFSFGLAIAGGIATTETGSWYHGCYPTRLEALNAGVEEARQEIDSRHI